MPWPTRPTLAAAVLGALAVLAVLGKSAVMLASVGGMAVAVALTRETPLTRVLAAVAVAGIGVALAAEAVHTAYHAWTGAAAGDDGGFWLSAVLVGGIDVAVLATVLLADAAIRRSAPARR